MRRKDYPFYETTVFRDLKAATEDPARRFPDRVAISWKDDPAAPDVTTRTYPEARDDVRAIGSSLIARGFSEAHVALLGEPSYEWICSYFALMGIGSVVVPLDPELAASDLAELINHADCTYVMFGDNVAAKLASVRSELPQIREWIYIGKAGRFTTDAPAAEGGSTDASAADECAASENVADENSGFEPTPLSVIIADGKARLDAGDTAYLDYVIDPDRMATIVFTSGTTGKGKGVMLSQNNIALDMTNGMYLFDITPKTMLLLPLHHTFGSTVNLVGHYVQGSEIFISSGLRYIGKEIKEQGPSHLILVPIFIEKIHDRIWATIANRGKNRIVRLAMRVSNLLRKIGIDLRRKLFREILDQLGGELRMIICGGAALRQEIIDDFDAFGITIMNGYGITECAPLVTCNRNEYQKKGSIGRPILHQDLRIADPDENGEGEICVRGPNVMLGYWKNPEATAAAIDEDGFFHTGDLGRLDEDGWLYITGRLKNLILFANGKNIYPEELENMLGGIPGLGEVVVYAGESRTQKSREVVVAEIYPDPDKMRLLNIEDPQSYFEQEVHKINKDLPAWKSIGLVRLRDSEFPKNTSRKIQRFNIDRSID